MPRTRNRSRRNSEEQKTISPATSHRRIIPSGDEQTPIDRTFLLQIYNDVMSVADTKGARNGRTGTELSDTQLVKVIFGLFTTQPHLVNPILKQQLNKSYQEEAYTNTLILTDCFLILFAAVLFDNPSEIPVSQELKTEFLTLFYGYKFACEATTGSWNKAKLTYIDVIHNPIFAYDVIELPDHVNHLVVNLFIRNFVDKHVTNLFHCNKLQQMTKKLLELMGPYASDNIKDLLACNRVLAVFKTPNTIKNREDQLRELLVETILNRPAISRDYEKAKLSPKRRKARADAVQKFLKEMKDQALAGKIAEEIAIYLAVTTEDYVLRVDKDYLLTLVQPFIPEPPAVLSPPPPAAEQKEVKMNSHRKKKRPQELNLSTFSSMRFVSQSHSDTPSGSEKKSTLPPAVTRPLTQEAPKSAPSTSSSSEEKVLPPATPATNNVLTVKGPTHKATVEITEMAADNGLTATLVDYYCLNEKQTPLLLKMSLEEKEHPLTPGALNSWLTNDEQQFIDLFCSHEAMETLMRSGRFSSEIAKPFIEGYCLSLLPQLNPTEYNAYYSKNEPKRIQAAKRMASLLQHWYQSHRQAPPEQMGTLLFEYTRHFIENFSQLAEPNCYWQLRKKYEPASDASLTAPAPLPPYYQTMWPGAVLFQPPALSATGSNNCGHGETNPGPDLWTVPRWEY